MYFLCTINEVSLSGLLTYIPQCLVFAKGTFTNHVASEGGRVKNLGKPGNKVATKGGRSKIAKNLFTWFVNAPRQDYVSISISFH